MKNLVIIITSLILFVCAKDFPSVTFIVMTQRTSHHQLIGDETVNKLKQNLLGNGIENANVIDLQKDIPVKGGWTYFPLFPKLKHRFPKSKWFIFLHETSEVELDNLQQILLKFDVATKQDHFIGYGIVDSGESKVHSSERTKLQYPDLSAGFILSRSLLERLSEEVESSREFLTLYTVDASYELAKISGIISPTRLVHEPRLCTAFHPDCAIYPQPTKCSTFSPDHSRKLLRQTLFAVKTCQLFHNSRLQIVRDTWGRVAENIIYVSEVENSDLQTVVLPGAEENTSRGHCRKSQSILKHFRANYKEKGWKWLVIADDDTMLSVSKLMDLLACYDPDEKVALGERYGHKVSGIRGRLGFDYLAGGAGMVFSYSTVETMMSLSHIHCKCLSATHPDDLHIGQCLDNLEIPVINNCRFHQARPVDYNETLLDREDPISFHKCEDQDPLKAYSKWFKDQDDQLLSKSKERICSD